MLFNVVWWFFLSGIQSYPRVHLITRPYKRVFRLQNRISLMVKLHWTENSKDLFKELKPLTGPPCSFTKIKWDGFTKNSGIHDYNNRNENNRFDESHTTKCFQRRTKNHWAEYLKPLPVHIRNIISDKEFKIKGHFF